MTVIAWDGKTLAADKRCNAGGLATTVTKIHRVPQGIVAFCGNVERALEVLQWLRVGADPAEWTCEMRASGWPNVLLITHRGDVLEYGSTPYPVCYEDRFTAAGTGRDYAMAAMHLGKTAREAVEVACLFDVSCGNGIDMLELDEALCSLKLSA